MDFGKVLTRAWEIIWKHKILWVFGILASCGSQGGNIGGRFNYQMDSSNLQNLPPRWQEFFRQFQNGFKNIPDQRIVGIAIAVVCIILLLVLVFWLASIFGRVGLITGAVQAEAGKSFTFGSLARDSFAVFVSAVGLNFLLALPPIILAVGIGIFVAITFGIGILCLLPLLCVLIPLGIAYNVYIELANVALVKERAGVTEALNRAWQVLGENLGNIAVMALILILGGIFVSFVLAIPFFLVFAPVLFGFLANTQSAQNTGLIISGICLLVALPVFIVLNGVLQSYLKSAWTLTYLQLSGAKKAVVVRAKKK
jgi:hypothetical protein